MNANEIQVAGTHYKDKAIQPWDYIVSNKMGYLEGNIIKYVSRWKDKGGVADLKKAQHYLQKLIEVSEPATMADVAEAEYQDWNTNFLEIGSWRENDTREIAFLYKGGYKYPVLCKDALAEFTANSDKIKGWKWASPRYNQASTTK